MAKYFKVIGCLALGLHCSVAMTQLPAEEYEPTPEYIDANFGEEGAARLAAGFSDMIPAGGATSSLAGMTDAADLVMRGLVLAQEYHYDVHGVPSTHTTFLLSEKNLLQKISKNDRWSLPNDKGENRFYPILPPNFAHLNK